MARVTAVKHSRQMRTCKVCQGNIDVGESYKWVHPRYRMRVDAHPDCRIPLSMTSSSKMVPIWESQEAYGKLTTRADKKADAEMLAETARGIGEEYQESASNQQEYFPDSEQAQENEEKGDALVEWADEIEAKASEIDEDEPEDDDEVAELRAKMVELEASVAWEVGKEDVTNGDGETLQELEDRIEAKLEELSDDSDIEELDELVQNCPE